MFYTYIRTLQPSTLLPRPPFSLPHTKLGIPKHQKWTIPRDCKSVIESFNSRTHILNPARKACFFPPREHLVRGL